MEQKSLNPLQLHLYIVMSILEDIHIFVCLGTVFYKQFGVRLKVCFFWIKQSEYWHHRCSSICPVCLSSRGGIKDPACSFESLVDQKAIQKPDTLLKENNGVPVSECCLSLLLCGSLKPDIKVIQCSSHGLLKDGQILFHNKS